MRRDNGGSLIRYFMEVVCTTAQSIATLTFGIEHSSTARAAVTLVGVALSLTSRHARTLAGAVLLPGITLAADVDLATTTGTQIESGTGRHRLEMPTSAG
jgi:hypothetical protein